MIYFCFLNFRLRFLSERTGGFVTGGISGIDFLPSTGVK